MPNGACRTLLIPLFVLAIVVAGSAANAAVTLLGVHYKPDRAFPEYECFWHPDQLPEPCGPSTPMGASVHVLLLNSGPSSVTVQDVTLAGISLELALYEEEQVVKRHPVSIYFALAHGAITQQQFNTLVSAGEPVWYKADPRTIAAGTAAQIVVRLRQVPTTPTVGIAVIHTGGSTVATVPVDPDQPQAAGVSFSSDLNRVYLYWRRGNGTAPTTILMDGINVTASTTTVHDPDVDIAASVLQLAQPLSPASFHVYQGIYTDGRVASAGVRTWANPFIYGTWGARDAPDGDYAAARAWVDDATNHCVNSLVVQGGSEALKSYLKTAEGRQYAADHGYGFVIDEIGKWSCQNPQLWFIRDEPDAADSRVTGLPGDKLVGSLADMAVEHGEELRAAYPTGPTTLNIDSTYTPFNWYNYGQVPDVLMTDPYYQNRLREALWFYPPRIPLYTKATYIYAVSRVARSSCEPNPLHVVLYSCEYVDTTTGQRFPFAPPTCKRIEVYYALAAGATGMSYWWYLPGKPSNGLGAGTSAALALWREIGLLGAEIRTAAELLVTACPAAVNMQPAAGLWVRCLVVGTDALLLLVVNDQYYNDEQGCHYTPATGASLTLKVPTWLQSPTAFEIAAGGIRDVTTQVAGDQLQMDLGTVDVTRMIVLTSSALLRNGLEQRYAEEVHPKLCSFAPDVCLPMITQQPVSQIATAGSTACFAIQASGVGTLSYQWQKNGWNLVDDGHYSGCNTATLTISNIDTADAANYRCRVSAANGSVFSHQAQLTVEPALIPGDFDDDGDVDQEDYGMFQRCLSGLSVPQEDPACAPARLDMDGDVDRDDAVLFLRCISGPDVLVAPDCDVPG
ncbi:MAG: immunoglobulin domain-containing protein [Phycisphaerae bacterium]